MTTESTDEYIETIYRLGGDANPVPVSDVAQRLTVSVVSASEMVKRLAAHNFVDYEPYKGILLTPTGRELALRIIRCHRLWERFLTDMLGIPWDLVHEEACRLEHATSSLVEARLATFLGDPTRCPHGSLVPGAAMSPDADHEMPLASLTEGQRAVVTRVSVEEPEMLRYIDELGLRPQANVEVERVAPFGGPMTLRVGDTQQLVAGQVASAVLVHVVE